VVEVKLWETDNCYAAYRGRSGEPSRTE